MTRTELIEVMARAILKAWFYDPEPDIYPSLEAFYAGNYPEHVDDAKAKASAALAAIEQAGLVVVPADATIEMLRDGDNAVITDAQYHLGPYEMAKAEYRAMIEAGRVK